MEILKEILNRRSIRKYKDKEIPDEVVAKLLHAAMQAPSANNQQPWEFIVVKNKETLKRSQKFNLMQKWLKMQQLQ